jgi:hypothetical protein
MRSHEKVWEDALRGSVTSGEPRDAWRGSVTWRATRCVERFGYLASPETRGETRLLGELRDAWRGSVTCRAPRRLERLGYLASPEDLRRNVSKTIKYRMCVLRRGVEMKGWAGHAEGIGTPWEICDKQLWTSEMKAPYIRSINRRGNNGFESARVWCCGLDWCTSGPQRCEESREVSQNNLFVHPVGTEACQWHRHEKGGLHAPALSHSDVTNQHGGKGGVWTRDFI